MGVEVPRFSLCWCFLLAALTFLWQVQFVMGKPFRFPESEGPMNAIGGNTVNMEERSMIAAPKRCPTNYILYKGKCRKPN